MNEKDYQKAFEEFNQLAGNQYHMDLLDDLCDAIDTAIDRHYEVVGSPFPGRILSNRVLAHMVLSLALEHEDMNWNFE